MVLHTLESSTPQKKTASSLFTFGVRVMLKQKKCHVMIGTLTGMVIQLTHCKKIVNNISVLELLELQYVG